MLELRFIRENIELVRQKCELRHLDPSLLERFSQSDGKRLELLAQVEALKNQRNTVSKEIAQQDRSSRSFH